MPQPDTNAYIAVMEEIKHRDRVAASYLNGERSTQFKASNIELAALQVRLITELIALASLASHKEVFEENRKKFAHHWQPKKIVSDVRALNPYFYPQPIAEHPAADEGTKRRLEAIPDGFLTSDELVEVHGRCGNLLHATNPYGRTRPYAEYEKLLPGWITRIRKLLNCHQVWLLDEGDRFWLVHMKDAKDARVHMYQFDAS